MGQRIFISAGEPSGDLHGSNLARALRRLEPSVELFGFGGEKMVNAGVDLIYPLAQHSVMGLVQVLKQIRTFKRLLNQGASELQACKPKALVMIDYPGFHFKLAQRAKALGIPVMWFVPPQIWAWASWRVKKMRARVDQVFSALPFEHEWFQARGVNSLYVGHPYFDYLSQLELDRSFVQQQQQKSGRVIALLPGSRNQEVQRNLEEMLQAAQTIHQQFPQTRFLVASFNEPQAQRARELIGRYPLPIEVHVHKTAEIISLAECAISVSGSVSLELMYHQVPSVIVYRIRHFDKRVFRQLSNVKYITLVNLLLDREIFPEFLTERNPSLKVAEKIGYWLTNEAERQKVKEALKELKEKVGQAGACEKAARVILSESGSGIDVTGCSNHF